MRIKVISKYFDHLHEEEEWGTVYVYGLPTAEHYYGEELLLLTSDH